jgi:hypothetical protein
MLSLPASIPVVGSPDFEEHIHVDECEGVHYAYSFGITGTRVVWVVMHSWHSKRYTSVTKVASPQVSTSS